MFTEFFTEVDYDLFSTKITKDGQIFNFWRTHADSNIAGH